MSFSKPLYEFIIDREANLNKNDIGRVSLSNDGSGRGVRYWIEDILPNHGNRIFVNETTGTVRLLAPFPPMSFSVTVHAAIIGSAERSQACATLRVHIVCHYKSQLWDVVRGWALLYPTTTAGSSNFELREMDESNYQDEDRPQIEPTVQLKYSVHMLQFGCIPRARVACNVTGNVYLHGIRLAKTGIGMKCLDESTLAR
ncbi:hypothetical protein FBUS_00948 [Fasciolopsis buskii]|uniref:Uncharacterized protein n=1 Tax=Fasciolopsis buskii TaxID=27845 RepID=A0A8E0RIP1_9TREM|nr:hypothetical protein FBUS_00948 [Fasciolopsis buski]